MRAAIYARVSTEEQAKTGHSIQDQIAKCEELARELGATRFEHFIDDGYSGADPNRPALQRLLQEVSEGKFDLVVCYDIDRWARDLGDQLAFTEIVEKHARLEFYTHRRGDPDSPEDTLFFQIKGAFAQYERAKIRQRTVSGRRRKALAGKVVSPGGWTGHPGAYGYRYNLDPLDPRLEIVEEEAKVVRQMYEWVAYENLGTRRVVSRLNGLGVPAPKGGRWGRSTVRRILTNPLYKGEFYHNRLQITEVTKNKRKVTEKPPEVWIPVPVPPIVSPELWELAQKKIMENRQRVRPNYAYDYLLVGHIYCGSCGRKYYTYPHHGVPYYRCSGSRKDVAGDNTCKSPTIPAKTNSRTRGVDDVVWSAVLGVLKDPGRILEELERHLSTGQQEQKKEELQKELDRLLKLQENILEQKDRLFDWLLEGIITERELKIRAEKLNSRLRETEAKIAETRSRIAALKTPEEVLTDTKELLARVLDRIDSLSTEEKREIIDLLDIRVIVHPDRSITVEWPFELPLYHDHADKSTEHQGAMNLCQQSTYYNSALYPQDSAGQKTVHIRVRVAEDYLERSYHTVSVRFNSRDVERLDRYLAERKIGQSEFLREIASRKEISRAVNKYSGSGKRLDTVKTFSVEDRLFRLLKSHSEDLKIPVATLVRELVLSGMEEKIKEKTEGHR